jgi:tRNA (guanine37-N1)-methyltransferase
MLTIKVPLQDAEKVKLDLVKKGLIDDRYLVGKDALFIYFPVVKRFASPYKFVEKLLTARVEKEGVKDSLARVLSPEQMQRLKTSADIVGDMAIIEIDRELLQHKKEIGEAFLKQNASIKTVLKKSGGHEGNLRIQKNEWLAGEKKTQSLHKENGCWLMVDVDKVYYSPRTATERLRIARLVRLGEEVLVMFSGCAPFPCVIAKNAKPAKVVGIELNPAGHLLGMENVRLNKFTNVELIQGDVRVVMPRLKTAFDRIIMPLPKTGVDFLGLALSAINPGGTIHYYSFQNEDEFDHAADQVRSACKKAKKKCQVIQVVKAGQIGQRMFRVCVDVQVQ